MSQYSQRVSTGLDDGYYAGEWINNGSSVGIGKNYLGGVVYSAFRFNNVNIPPGATITSAYLKLKASDNTGSEVAFKIHGIDEDDTANFSSDPNGRSKTTASVNWTLASVTAETEYTSPDIKTVIQEIIDRGSWSSGNDLGLISADNGTSNDRIDRFYAYDGSSTKCALLEINYTGSSSSASVSPSPSPTPSASKSLSISSSPSLSPSLSISPSPSPVEPFFGLKIAKSGYNVLETGDPTKLIFSSDYGTLKYFEKLTTTVELDANAGDIACQGSVTHDLGYYPYVEVFVRVYIGSPGNQPFEYCPFAGSGATVAYNANYKITKTAITLYGEIVGMSTSTWSFEFIVFVFKNDLTL